MIYRTLTTQELETIRGEFTSRGVDLPNPENSFVMGAWDGERLLGFWVAQLQIHLEPLMLYDPHALSGLISATEKEILSRVGPCSVFLSAEGRVAGIAQAFNYRPANMFTKEFK